MPRNNKQNRRMLITVVVILALAVTGLVFLQVDSIGATGALTAERDVSGVAGENDGTASSDDFNGVSNPAQPSVFSAVAKMLSALVVVVVLAYGALWALRRMMGRRYGGGIRKGALEVLQTTYVGPHKAISLVKVGQRSVLVGVTDNQISTLTELNTEETQEIIEAAVDTDRCESFSRVLSAASNKLKIFGLPRKRTALET